MGCGIQSKNKEVTVLENSQSNSGMKNTAQSFVTMNKNKFTDIYKVGKPLGKGSFGEVRTITHKVTEQERAVKLYKKDKNQPEGYIRIKSEIEILKRLEHPSVVKLYEYFEDDKRVYLVLEKCNGGELFEEIFKNKYLNEKNAAIIIKQLLSVVSYLHENNIVHRDIKPENILLEEREDYLNIKIIDFGAATLFGPTIKLTEMIGSAFYIAPEVARYNYNELCDEWSCGIILYILLCGSPPFNGNTNEEIISKVKSGKFLFKGPIWDTVSNPAKDLINKLLSSAKSRITAKEALLHPWIQGEGQYPVPSSNFLNKTLDNLKEFSYKNKFRDALSVFISSQFLTHQETKELNELFKSIDANGDGRLSIEEMKNAFSQVSSILNPDEYIENIMREVDTDGNGYIDYNEFLKATLNDQELYSKKNLKLAFEIFDLDHSGKISSKELQEIFSLGNMSSAMWDEIVKQADENSDGEIDFEEFCRFVMEISKHT